MSSHISALSLDSYVQLYRALTKGSDKVQSVTPIEECYYKISDIKQLLMLHGCSMGKLNKSEVLQALKGSSLINPITINNQTVAEKDSSGTKQPAHLPDDAVDHQLPFSPADLVTLGWVKADALCEMQLLQLDISSTAAGRLTDADAAAVGLAPPSASTLTTRATSSFPSCAATNFTSAHVATTAAITPTAAVGAVSSVTRHRAESTAAGHNWQTQQQGIVTEVYSKCNDLSAKGSPELASTLLSASATEQPSAKAISAAQQAPQQVLTGQHRSATVDSALPPVEEPSSLQRPFFKAIPPDAGHQPHSPAVKGDLGSSHLESSRAKAHTAVQSQLLQQAGLLDVHALPSHAHTNWLLQQLQRFVMAEGVNGGVAQPSHAAVTCSTPVAAATAAGPTAEDNVDASAAEGLDRRLLGACVCFVLMEEMPVQTGHRHGAELILPAGAYKGRVLRSLGSTCQPELCETHCTGGHCHYRVRILPPQKLKGEDSATAATATQAATAASGRPVLLILDLHPRLRCGSFRELLQLTSGQLQDAWMLLAGHDDATSVADQDVSSQPGSTAIADAAGETSRHSHARSGRLQCKRARI